MPNCLSTMLGVTSLAQWKMSKHTNPKQTAYPRDKVLHCPYEFDKARLVVKEMTDLMVLDLVDKGLVTNQIVLTIGYDIENITDKTEVRVIKVQLQRTITVKSSEACSRNDKSSKTNLIYYAYYKCGYGIV